MSHPLVYIDTSRIREGKMAELAGAMDRLAIFVEQNVPPVLSYAFFIDEAHQHMTVTAIHPDSASLEFHMDTGAAEFRRFVDLIELLRIDVYGQVGPGAMERLHRKAAALGGAAVHVHRFHAGFDRIR